MKVPTSETDHQRQEEARLAAGEQVTGEERIDQNGRPAIAILPVTRGIQKGAIQSTNKDAREINAPLQLVRIPAIHKAVHPVADTGPTGPLPLGDVETFPVGVRRPHHGVGDRPFPHEQGE